MQQLRTHEQRYQSLENRFEVQRNQRMSDKAKVDDAYEHYQAAVECCDKLQSELEATEKRLESQLQAKDRELASLKHNQACANAELEEAQRKELASKDAENQTTSERGQQENATLQKAYTKVVAERDEIKRKANNEKRKIWTAEKTKRIALIEEKDSLDIQLKQSTADFHDALAADQETIMGLTARNLQLENEHRAMARTLRQKHPDAKALEMVINGNDADKEMEKGNRARIKHLREQNENILDSLEHMRGHCNRHHEAEQDARHEANHLHSEIGLLKEKATLQKEQFRNVVKQLELIQQGSIPAGGHCTALDRAEGENEELRNRLQVSLNEKAEMQTKLNKFDDDNLRQAIDLDFKDDAMIEKEQTITSLEKKIETAIQELRMLRKVAHGTANILTDSEEKHNLLAYLSKTTDENRELIEENTKLCQKIEKTRQWGQTIVDKCDTDVRKARAEASWAANLYHTEAVPTTERLHNEIAALKAKKGEAYFVEPLPYPNPEVTERKILPYACLDGLDGVPPELIPAAAHDHNLRPLVSATVDALISLRPQGYYPLLVGDKIWLKRLVEPFYEEDAVQRICQGQGAWNSSLSSIGSGHSSISITYAPRNAPVASTTSIDEEAPARFGFLAPNTQSKSSIPIAMRTSCDDLHFVESLKKMQPTQAMRPQYANNKSDVGPTASRSTLKHKAIRRVVPTPAYETPRAPAYRSSWLGKHEGLTRENYNDMDPDLQLDMFNTYIRAGNEVTLNPGV
jgi:hypothetical protein